MKPANLSQVLAAAMAATVAMTGAVYAVTPSHSHEDAQHAQIQAKHEGYGVLKAVNTEAGKVQLAHGAIPSLGWPAMTMWFALRDPLPKDVMVGDNVRFELEQVNSKEWVIIRIERKR